MSKIISFGETVEGYDIPVLNEREIRAGAGILFVLMFVAILTTILKSDFTLLKYAVTIFMTNMLIRMLVNPRFAPTLIIGIVLGFIACIVSVNLVFNDNFKEPPFDLFGLSGDIHAEK